MRTIRELVERLRLSDSAESRAVRGGMLAAWTNVAAMVIKFVGNILLARLLIPHDFGTANVGFLVLTAVVLLSDVGLDTAVVRSPHGEDPRYLNVVWTVGILRSLVLWAATAAVAVPVARFFREPILVPMLPVMGFVVVVEALRSTYLDVCDRRLVLRPRMMIELRGQILTTVGQLGFAWVWPSPWAIVAGAMIASAYRAVESHRMNDGPRNRFAYDRAFAHEIFHFGKWIFVSTALTFAASQGDRALLGRVMSLEMLGVYGLAATVATVPQQIHSVIASRVIFPLVSSYVRENPDELGARLREARSIVLLVMLFAVTGVIAFSGPFFGLLYTNDYAQAGDLAPVLAWIFWLSILQNSVDRLPIAFGDSDLLAMISFVSAVARLTCGFVGFRLYGLWGFLGGLFVGATIEYATAQAIAYRRYHVRLAGQDAAYTVALIVCTGFIAAVHDQSMGIRVAVGVAVVAAVGLFVARALLQRIHAKRPQAESVETAIAD